MAAVAYAAAAAEATVAAAGATKTVLLPLYMAAAAHFAAVAVAAPVDGGAAGANTVLELGDRACHAAAISWLWRGNTWCTVYPSPWSCFNAAKRANRTLGGVVGGTC